MEAINVGPGTLGKVVKRGCRARDLATVISSGLVG
jgi:hypothetical protein